MFWAVIMAGGRGTRFWPESRNKTPKQFLPIVGETTLLEQTVERLSGIIPKERVLVVTQADKVGLVRKLLRIPASQILGEPVGRNTAPCMILAASAIRKKDPEAVLAMLPADHLIERADIFRKALQSAAAVTRSEKLPVTFGIRPDYASTGYGYLEMEPSVYCKQGRFSVYRLKRFHEKPKLKTAQKFLKASNYLWNSGMFVWEVQSLLEASKKYLPEAYELSQKITASGSSARMKALFPKMPNISIDYGVMEKMKGRILTIPVSFGWNDLGGWKTVADLSPGDKAGNFIRGEAVMVESFGNYVKSSKRLIAMVGVHDYVVIDTDDTLLICPKDQTESIRDVVSALKNRKLERYL